MESNEHTELTSKIEPDLQTESRMTAKGGRLGGGEIDQKGKRTHGHVQQCFWSRVREGYKKGSNINGKKYNKNYLWKNRKLIGR